MTSTYIGTRCEAEPASIAAEDRFREAAAALLEAFRAEGHPEPEAAVRAALDEALR